MGFSAILLEEKDGKVAASVQSLDDSRLPAGEVTIRVAYSDLNYKDGLILKGLARLVRTYPHIPGIDLSGTVESSSAPAFQPGDSVILTGWATGERQWGGYAQKARAKADHLVKLPAAISLKQAMALGTAGFTAMLAAMALEEHGLAKGKGTVLVTGAAGGVGSVAVAILSRLGHHVTAATGRKDQADYLRGLGAQAILDRAEIAEIDPKKPLDSARWSAVVDTVGGKTLARVLTQVDTHGAVAACGNAAGNDLPTTVLPFILRGVALLGIDSNFCPPARRQRAWDRLAREMPMDKLDAMTSVVPLAGALAEGEKILKGQVRGRAVIDVNA
jgi:acrylyl-CoA reductase (NADPH)